MKRPAAGVVAATVAPAGLFASSGAPAQTGAYPVKARRLIVPFQAGGAADVVGRMTAQMWTKVIRETAVRAN